MTESPPRPGPREVLVIVPTYNERENLRPLVPAILAQGDSYRVLIVDDHSPDGTGETADRLARKHPGRVEVLHRRGPRGLGAALRAGFTRALAGSADVVCQLDADLSHDPASLPALVGALDDLDVVVGSRYLRRGGVSAVGWPRRRVALSAFANCYVRTITGLPVRDCTSGFRAWRRAALAAPPLGRPGARGYAFLVETLYEAVRSGARVGEVPIVFAARRHGRSKVSLRVLAESCVTPWRLRLRRGRLGPNRAPSR